jgi:hypothetical protein
MPKIHYCKKVFEGVICGETNPEKFHVGKYSICKDCNKKEIYELRRKEKEVKDQEKSKEIGKNVELKDFTIDSKEIVSIKKSLEFIETKYKELEIKYDKLNKKNKEILDLFYQLKNNTEENSQKDNKIKKNTIPKILKDLCWKKWIGESVAKNKCLCCEINEITMSSFQCGHVISEVEGGKLSIENLRPICVGCNLSMGTENMFSFKIRCGFGSL